MKLTDKLTKCGDSLTVNMYDNGYMVEVSGRDDKDDYKSAKIMCTSLNEVYEVISEASQMPRE
jgi:ketol-acid reductoisomerase